MLNLPRQGKKQVKHQDWTRHTHTWQTVYATDVLQVWIPKWADRIQMWGHLLKVILIHVNKVSFKFFILLKWYSLRRQQCSITFDAGCLLLLLLLLLLRQRLVLFLACGRSLQKTRWSQTLQNFIKSSSSSLRSLTPEITRMEENGTKTYCALCYFRIQ